MTDILPRRGENKQPPHLSQVHVTTWAEIGGLHLQAEDHTKDCWKLRKLLGVKEDPPPEPSEGTWPC